MLDRKYCGKMIGVGSKSIEGKINYLEIMFDFGYVQLVLVSLKELIQ